MDDSTLFNESMREFSNAFIEKKSWINRNSAYIFG